MTFWFFISTWKIKKTSASFEQYSKFYTSFKSYLRAREHEIYEKLEHENVQFRRIKIFFSIMECHLVTNGEKESRIVDDIKI